VLARWGAQGTLGYVAVQSMERARAGEASAKFALAQRLQHPNVATVHSLCTTPTMLWLVLDLCPGGTLDSLLALDTPGEASARALALDLAAGLQHCHARGVVVGDLRPTRVLVDSGWLRLGSLARGRDLTGQVPCAIPRGRAVPPECLPYAAPELAHPQAGFALASMASDRWALGALLFAIATGHAPFAGGTAPVSTEITVLAAMRNGALGPAVSRLPPRLAPLVLALLSADPALRPDWAAICACPYWEGRLLYEESTVILPASEVDTNSRDNTPASRGRQVTPAAPPPGSASRAGSSQHRHHLDELLSRADDVLQRAARARPDIVLAPRGDWTQDIIDDPERDDENGDDSIQGAASDLNLDGIDDSLSDDPSELEMKEKTAENTQQQTKPSSFTQPANNGQGDLNRTYDKSATDAEGGGKSVLNRTFTKDDDDSSTGPPTGGRTINTAPSKRSSTHAAVASKLPSGRRALSSAPASQQRQLSATSAPVSASNERAVESTPPLTELGVTRTVVTPHSPDRGSPSAPQPGKLAAPQTAQPLETAESDASVPYPDNEPLAQAPEYAQHCDGTSSWLLAEAARLAQLPSDRTVAPILGNARIEKLVLPRGDPRALGLPSSIPWEAADEIVAEGLETLRGHLIALIQADEGRVSILI
jgi:serine/threonine protein kinase